MTWTLASFTILFLALAAGFGWYERTHPSSKVLALVATLAALAAIGRIAFAPIPNVKPTTDIVLLSGYVLGGAPGFVVGAVAALASNLFFGQGPWTPFQMGAWGLCGVFGAMLGATTARRMGRWPLALCCGFAGVFFGAIMDFQSWVALSGSHTLAQYFAISGVSLSYNVAHVIGNVVFCLAFGPTFVRALSRFRARMTVTWRPLPPAATGGIAALLLALVLAGGMSATRPASAGAAATAAERATAYLVRSQNTDGGWGGAPKQASTSLYSAWVDVGLGAVRRACPGRAVAYMRLQASRAASTSDIARSVLGLRACRVTAIDSKGRALVPLLRSRQASNGSIGNLTNQTSFFVLAMRAGGAKITDSAIKRAGTFIARQQNSDRGFGYARKGGPSGIDDTAAAIEAIHAAGGSRMVISRAVSYLRARQNLDGGFPLTPGAASNTQSTSFAVQALVAAGINPSTVRRKGSRTPIGYIQSLMQTNGSVRYSRTSTQTPIWVTAQALAALARRALPV